jgi:hypothetical protein
MSKMAIRRICVNEVTTAAATVAQTVLCSSPAYTPVASGDECNVALFNLAVNLGTSPPTLSFSYSTNAEYQYLQNGTTFEDFCNVLNQSYTYALASGVTSCCGLSPTATASISCNPSGITTTSTMVQCTVTFAFTVTNLCSSTIICVSDTTCP